MYTIYIIRRQSNLSAFLSWCEHEAYGNRTRYVRALHVLALEFDSSSVIVSSAKNLLLIAARDDSCEENACYDREMCTTDSLGLFIQRRLDYSVYYCYSTPLKKIYLRGKVTYSYVYESI